MISLIILITLAFAIALVFKRGFRRRVAHSKTHEIYGILNPSSRSLSALLRARAEPNQRLARAFGLHNTFVSADPDVRKHFVARAVQLLHSHSRRMTGFPDTTRHIIQEISSHRSSFELDTFVQAVTFCVIVVALLEGDVPAHDLDDVIFVVQAINRLWSLSKTCNHMPPGVLETMNRHLRRWLPHLENPLDLVIPTYETMWRVVAITVARAGTDDNAQAAFLEYLKDPSDAQFQHFTAERPSVEAFILEVMRLHPPSKHISRASSPPLSLPSWLPSALLRPLREALSPVHVADIQALHRDADIWGSAAMDFDPMRLHPSRMSLEQKGALLPFGYGPLRCVAYKEAPRIAAVLAAVILEASAGTKPLFEIVRGAKIGGRDGWDGWFVQR